MNKKIIVGVPLALVLVGLAIIFFSYAQTSYPATVLSVVKETYTPEKAMPRGRAQAVYGEEMEVGYGDGQTVRVTYSSTNKNHLPKAGDEIRISRWFFGMAVHPNRTLIGVGGACAMFGGLILALMLLTKWSIAWTEARERRKNGRNEAVNR